MAFRCVIVTPEQQVLDESLAQAILPAHDGLVGILTDRAPLLVKLGQGPMRVDLAAGGSQNYYVEGGIAQMKDNNLTVLTEHAVAAGEIDAEAARAEYNEATARRVTADYTAEDRERQINRARAKQQVAAMR